MCALMAEVQHSVRETVVNVVDWKKIERKSKEARGKLKKAVTKAKALNT